MGVRAQYYCQNHFSWDVQMRFSKCYAPKLKRYDDRWRRSESISSNASFRTVLQVDPPICDETGSMKQLEHRYPDRPTDPTDIRTHSSAIPCHDEYMSKDMSRYQMNKACALKSAAVGHFKRPCASSTTGGSDTWLRAVNKFCSAFCSTLSWTMWGSGWSLPQNGTQSGVAEMTRGWKRVMIF